MRASADNWGLTLPGLTWSHVGQDRGTTPPSLALAALALSPGIPSG